MPFFFCSQLRSSMMSVVFDFNALLSDVVPVSDFALYCYKENRIDVCL